MTKKTVWCKIYYIKLLWRSVPLLFLKIAGLTIKVDNIYDYITGVCRGYTTDPSDNYDIEIRMTEEDLESEPQPEGTTAPPHILESTATYRKIAEALPSFDAFVMHGSAVAVDGVAYIITAKSGIGKTTHTRLWLEALGERAHVLNGDKPVIRFIDGKPIACGTPWRGKENYGISEMLPLGGIVLFGRGSQNKVYPIDRESAFFSLSSQIYRSREANALLKTIELTDKVLSSVRIIRAECNMEREAAELVYNAIVADPIYV